MADKLKINSKNCPTGVINFACVTGKGILNEDNTSDDDVYEYKFTLELDEDSAGPLLDEIDDFITDMSPSKKELVKVPYQTSDDYDGIPEGKVWLSAKAYTTYEDKKTGDLKDTVITIYDSQGDKVSLPEGTGIGNGSTGKVLGSVTMWERKKEYGFTLWLSGTQISDFIPYEFEEQVEVMEGGSFKGFNDNTPQLEKDEESNEEPTRSRRSNRASKPAEDEKPTRSRRSNRASKPAEDEKPTRSRRSNRGSR